MAKEHIDELDRKIISILSKDSTISYSKLAEKVGTSRNTAYRRVKNLKDMDVLMEETKGNRIVDMTKLEKLGISTILMRLNVNAEDIEATSSLLTGMKEVKMLMESYGKFDFVLLLMLETGDERDYIRSLREKMAGEDIKVNDLETSQITTLNKIDFSTPTP